MSGGYFEYKNGVLEEIQEELLEQIKDNPLKYNEKVIECFRKALAYSCAANKALHHVDYLLSGDYGEESFLEAWEKDLGDIDIRDSLDSWKRKTITIGLRQ
jgi:hypothetical protein